MLSIKTIKDPLILEARELNVSKNRLSSNKCLLEGCEAIKWAMAKGIAIKAVFYCEREEHEVRKQLSSMEVPCYHVSEGIIKKITNTNYTIPLVAIGVLPNQALKLGKFVVVMDNLHDQGNIGTIVRTANAFGISDFVATQANFDWYYKKTIDASRGTVFSSQLKRYSTSIEAVNALKAQGYQIIATSPYGSKIQSTLCLADKPVALIVGNETHGVSQEIISMADHVVQIPMYPEVESLNVAVATGISIYELKMKMVLAMLKSFIYGNLGRNVNLTGQLIRKVFDKRISELTGVSGMQAILLMIMKCDEIMTEEQIARDTGWQEGAELTLILDELMRKDFIAKRDRGYTLTARGELFLAEIWTSTETIETEITKGLSGEEKERLKYCLQVIQDNCQTIINH